MYLKGCFFLIFMMMVLSQSLVSAQSFTRLGIPLYGEAAGDGFGVDVKLSADGQRLIVGANNNQGNSSTLYDAGHARVYEWNPTTNSWEQLGRDINGNNTQQFGFDVDISLDGERVVVSAAESDIVRVFRYSGVRWTQVGNDIISGIANSQFGFSVSMARNGNRIAVGAPLDNNSGSSAGLARVYDWNGSDWVQVGNELQGSMGDWFGTGVSLSEDGQYLAVGAENGSNGSTNTGKVSIYRYQAGSWTMVGNPILSNSSVNENFGSQVAMADNGHAVVIGDARAGTTNTGAVEVYCWNGWTWSKKGASLTGLNNNEYLGSSVAISADGNVVVSSGGATSNNRGKLRAYTWNGYIWEARTAVTSSSTGDRFGRSCDLALLPDGSMRVAVGANFNNTAGVFAGSAEVYTSCAPIYLIDSVNTCNTSYPWIDGFTYVTSTDGCSAPQVLTGSNSNGCDSFRILHLNIDPNYTPNTSISQQGNALQVAPALGATYQWLDCANNNTPIAGATSFSFNPPQTGQYAVEITENGCTGTSSCFNFSMTNITTLEAVKGMQVYPNPTQQQLTLALEQAQEQVQVHVMTLSGAVLETHYFEQLQQVTLDLEAAMPVGLYVVRVQVGQQAPVYLKFVKQ